MFYVKYKNVWHTFFSLLLYQIATAYNFLNFDFIVDLHGLAHWLNVNWWLRNLDTFTTRPYFSVRVHVTSSKLVISLFTFFIRHCFTQSCVNTFIWHETFVCASPAFHSRTFLFGLVIMIVLHSILWLKCAESNPCRFYWINYAK